MILSIGASRTRLLISSQTIGNRCHFRQVRVHVYKKTIKPPPKTKLANATTPAMIVEGPKADAPTAAALLLDEPVLDEALVPVAEPRTNVADLEVPPTAWLGLVGLALGNTRLVFV
jgi:hypothetical protein